MSMQKLGVNQPYDEGHRAYHDGQKVGQCPYAIQSTDGVNWREGWFDAANEDDPAETADLPTT